MELCPKCKKMTAEKDKYTGDLVCYNGPCYEEGFDTKMEKLTINIGDAIDIDLEMLGTYINNELTLDEVAQFIEYLIEDWPNDYLRDKVYRYILKEKFEPEE